MMVVANLLRTATTIQVNPHIKNQIRDPRKLWKLPWDDNKEIIVEGISSEQLKEISELL